MSEQLIDTNTLYPEMMSNTNLLIVDYNVLRYHSFDLMRWLLLDKNNFMSFNPEYHGIIEHSDSLEEMIMLSKTCIKEVNPLEVFTNYDTSSPFPRTLRNKLKELFLADNQKTTLTDVNYRIGTIFGRDDINGCLLKFKSDKTEYNLPGNVEVYESDNILDINVLLRFIDEHDINAIMVDSIDLAATIAYKVNHRMSFMIANYRYNYTVTNGLQHIMIPKGVQALNALEFKKKHEFGFFDPFSDLATYMRRKTNETDSVDIDSESVSERDDNQNN